MSNVMQIKIYSRVGNTSKCEIDGLSASTAVKDLRLQTANMIDVPSSELELIFAGQCLQDEKMLESYGIKSGATIHVFKKVVPDNTRADPVSDDSYRRILTALRPMLTKPAFRNTMERMLNDPATVNTLIDTVPGLGNDPAAIAIIQDNEMLMLAILADAQTMRRVILAHPSLGLATRKLAEMVTAECDKPTSLTTPRRDSYNLDRMSDEDDDEEDEFHDGSQQQPSTPQSSRNITAAQLAAALATTGQTGQTPGAAGPSTPRGASAASGFITTDFFRQAMVAAAGAPPRSDVTQSQLQQLRDMGITDEVLARRALEQSGGDIQAALSIIFDGL